MHKRSCIQMVNDTISLKSYSMLFSLSCLLNSCSRIVNIKSVLLSTFFWQSYSAHFSPSNWFMSIPEFCLPNCTPYLGMEMIIFFLFSHKQKIFTSTSSRSSSFWSGWFSWWQCQSKQPFAPRWSCTCSSFQISQLSYFPGSQVAFWFFSRIQINLLKKNRQSSNP